MAVRFDGKMKAGVEAATKRNRRMRRRKFGVQPLEIIPKQSRDRKGATVLQAMPRVTPPDGRGSVLQKLF